MLYLYPSLPFSLSLSLTLSLTHSHTHTHRPVPRDVLELNTAEKLPQYLCEAVLSEPALMGSSKARLKVFRSPRSPGAAKSSRAWNSMRLF